MEGLPLSVTASAVFWCLQRCDTEPWYIDFVSSPRFQMVRRENKLHSSLLGFSQPFLTTNPSGCRKEKKKILNRYLISSCAIWKRRTRFIFHFYRDRRSRRTVKAVSYSSGSETRARGGKKWHFSNIFCLLRTGSGAFTITICPACARNAVAIRFYGIRLSVSARVTK